MTNQPAKRFRPTLRQYRIQELIAIAAVKHYQETYKEARMWSRCAIYALLALNFNFWALQLINYVYGL